MLGTSDAWSMSRSSNQHIMLKIVGFNYALAAEKKEMQSACVMIINLGDEN